MGHNRCLMFCQINADKERRVSRHIVVVQHPSLVFPQFRPLPAHSIPQIAKTSWYNCLFTIWPCGKNSWWTMPFQSKNTTNVTRSLTDSSVLCLHLGFNFIPIKPSLISCYDVIKKVFITICIVKQILTDFNTVLFLIISQQTARILHWCDATEVFQKKFDGKILGWCPLRQQLLGKLNDFHESRQELCRHVRYLLMWKVIQAWDLHRPTFCPL